MPRPLAFLSNFVIQSCGESEREEFHLLYLLLLALVSCVPIASVLVGVLPIDDAMRDTFIPVMLTLLVWPAVGFIALVWAADLMLKRRRLQALLTLAFAVCVALSFFPVGRTFFGPLLSGTVDLNRRLHFATMKNIYDADVRALDGSAPHFKLFVWEMDPVGGSGVIYDSNDDILLPKNRRPRDWWRREKKYPAVLQELCYVDPVGSHYYIVTFGCYGEGK